MERGKGFGKYSARGRTVNSVARYARKRLLLMRVLCAVLQGGAWSLRQVVDEVEGGVEVGIHLLESHTTHHRVCYPVF